MFVWAPSIKDSRDSESNAKVTAFVIKGPPFQAPMPD